MTPQLVVSETPAAMWHYHLRLIAESDALGGPRGGGLVGAHALCGRQLGWDTAVPVASYGRALRHLPEHFCAECAVIAADLLEHGLAEVRA